MLLSIRTGERPGNTGTHSLTCQVRSVNGGFWCWEAVQCQHIVFHCSELLFLFCTTVLFHLILHHRQTLAENFENFIWLAIFTSACFLNLRKESQDSARTTWAPVKQYCFAMTISETFREQLLKLSVLSTKLYFFRDKKRKIEKSSWIKSKDDAKKEYHKKSLIT